MADEWMRPTPYADVNAILRELMASVQAILADRFVGMYLYGSLAAGDFSPETSDIDFLVVTDAEPAAEQVEALRQMHARIGAGRSKWALELEGSYIPRDALRRYDPRLAQHLHIDRGSASLHVVPHERDWVIQRHILREHGVVLAGPPIQALIDPIDPEQIRKAARELLEGWWTQVAREGTRLRHTGYQAYAVLTMCRALYSLEHGTLVSKPVAARWAQATLDARWSDLIERALVWRDGAVFDDFNGAREFIRYAAECAKGQ